MQSSNGLLSKISRAFLLQAALISIAALLSVFFAKIVLEEVLIKEAIEQEADYFWTNHQRDPDFTLPDTLNLTGFLVREELPQGVRELTGGRPGFFEFDDETTRLVVHVSQQAGKTLYLLYNRGQVDSLATYYGVFPLALVLIVLYLSLWLTYTFSRRALSPVTQLARQVNRIDFNSPDFTHIEVDRPALDANDEIAVLTDAIDHLGERLDAFITRERNFTRDASHELRSPLTVINIAADMLLSEQELSRPAQKSIQRIKRAVSDMQELTDAFLLLARESEQALSQETVCINDILEEEIERIRLLNRDKHLEISYAADYRICTKASDKVLSVLFGNLIRNAFLYTDSGGIDVSIAENTVVISDSGKGMLQQDIEKIFKPYYRGDADAATGHGIGLTIVKRFSDRFHWPIRVDSAPGTGTRIEVQFPQADLKPL